MNREETQLYPIYVDPVHDFGFLRFNPSKLEYMETGEVQLAPEAAHMGLEIRVVGNDSGEKVGWLARGGFAAVEVAKFGLFVLLCIVVWCGVGRC